MSWIGKILAVLVMVLALVWMWFTASVYAARTNWRTQAVAYKDALKDAVTARESEYRTYLAERDALARQVKSEQTRADGLAAQLEKAKDEVAKTAAQLAAQNDAATKLGVQTAELQANLTAQQGRADKLGNRVNELENEKVQLTITAEKAVKNQQAAETLTKQAQADKLNADKKVEELSNQLADARASGFTGGGGSGGASLFAPRPTPIREGTRGTVESYQEGILQITLGIDHGVTKGATLDVFRTGADAKYLGTVVIDRAYPQSSVGTFRPADVRRNVRQLRPEELPKAGDRVGRIGSITTAP
jgi:uncharacterized phage infection (PIP) family protein YhgE